MEAEILALNLKCDFKNDFINCMSIIEKAHWFYVDTLIPKYEAKNINFINFISYILLLYNYPHEIKNVLFYNQKYNNYKKNIPTAGGLCIYENTILLVKIKGHQLYGVSKGKKNNNESIIETATREVLEETGINISTYITDPSAYIKILKTKLYIIKLKEQIDVSLLHYDMHEIETIKWFDYSVINKFPSLFTRQARQAVKYLQQFNI